jgi:hypothetical protein
LKKGNCDQTIIKMARDHMSRKEFAYDGFFLAMKRKKLQN